MKKLFILTAGLFVSIAIFQSCSTSAKASTQKMLRFNFEKGKGYNYDMVWDLDTKVQGISTAVTMDASYSMIITDDDGTIKTVSTSYDGIKMNIEAAGMNMKFDTSDPEVEMSKGNPLAMMNKIMRGMIGKSFTMKVNQEGDVLAVEGFDKIIMGIIDSAVSEPSVREQLQKSMKEQFNEQSLKDNFAQALTIFPNKEVKLGDTWEKKFITGGPTGGTYTTTYTVKEIEGEHVTLDTETKITPSGKGSDVEGTQTGTVLLDSKTGLMINASFDQDLKVKSEGQTVQVTGKGKIKGTKR